MKIKNLSFVIILLFFSNLSLAQQISISGKVLDSNNAPIEFANVFLQNQQDSTIQYGTISELNGSFNFEISQRGNYQIVISFIGYQDWRKEIFIEKSVELEVINLSASANELGEVTVTSTRKIIERKEDKLVFNVAASPLNTGYDGMEVLQRSPNVIIDGESITMRNEAATVLINGRISNLSGENLANFIRNLRSDEIKSIEIQTNLSANTDAESSGGVINIILKKKPIGFDGNVRTQNTFKSKGDRTNYVGTNFNNGAERWNIYGGYNFIRATTESINESSIDYFESNDLLLEDGTWQNFRKRHNYQLGFGFDVNENHVFGAEFFGTDYNNQVDNISLINLTNGGESIENGRATLDGSFIYDLMNFTVNYAWTIDTLGSKLQVFGDYTDQLLADITEVFSEYEQGVFLEKRERNNNSSNTKIYAVQADLEKYFFGGIKLETGSKWTFTDRANDLRSDNFLNNEWQANERTSAFNYGEKVFAGYLSMSKKILEKNFFKLGLRVENTDLEREDITQDTTIGQNYTDWFPSFYFSRDLPHNNILSFSYSKRLRRPSFQFLNNSIIKINDFRYELGNPDLRPEYVHNFEVSLKQKKQNIDIFYQKTNEAINGIYFLEGVISYYRKFNAGSQTQYGISYNRFGNLTDWWYINANVSLWNRKFTNENGEDSFQRATSYIRMSNNITLSKTTKLDISGYYRSRYEDAFYISFPIYRINVMLEKTFFNKALNCRIYFNDVFNTFIDNSERPFSDFLSKSSYKPQSRTIQIRVAYNFSNKNKMRKGKNRSKNEARRRL